MSRNEWSIRNQKYQNILDVICKQPHKKYILLKEKRDGKYGDNRNADT